MLKTSWLGDVCAELSPNCQEWDAVTQLRSAQQGEKRGGRGVGFGKGLVGSGFWCSLGQEVAFGLRAGRGVEENPAGWQRELHSSAPSEGPETEWGGKGRCQVQHHSAV